ncbi:MAG: transketolase [Clostridiales bacterium]|nr:transketolase [Clostridiales bacterium]
MSARTIDRARVIAAATRMRIDIVEMIAAAGSGHPGGSLSAADIVATLYFGLLKHDPAQPGDPDRDRFVLSKGHAAPVLYAALAEAGYFGREHLGTLRALGSMLQGHPDSKKTPGVEISTGSLGQGLSVACGIALGLRGGSADARTVYCLLGDGECQEGQVWEAAMFAAHYRLGNLVAIVDHNGLQIDGACSEVMCLGTIADKFAAFGWEVDECDGHDIDAIVTALTRVRRDPVRPGALIAHTVKGRGVSFMEGDAGWHGRAPTPEQAQAAIEELTAAAVQKGANL